MTAKPWTPERRDAHASRLKAIFSDPTYKARKKQQAAVRDATPPRRMIEPSVYDYRLDVGDDDDLDIVTMVWPPQFDLTLMAVSP